jgi:hypothetical protein
VVGRVVVRCNPARVSRARERWAGLHFHMRVCNIKEIFLRNPHVYIRHIILPARLV